MISMLQTYNSIAWPRVHAYDNICLFYTFNARFTLNYKSPMLLKPTSPLQSRTGARGDGSSAMVTHILWFPTGVWVSDWVSVCLALCFFFLIFGLFMKKIENLHKYLLYLCAVIFSEVGFAQSFSPLEQNWRENVPALPDTIFMNDCKPGFCLLPDVCRFPSFSPVKTCACAPSLLSFCL